MQWTEGYILPGLMPWKVPLTEPDSSKQNAAFAYIVLQPTFYIDWAKPLCNLYTIITLHEVKDICAQLLPYVAAARTNYGLSIHQRNKCSIYPC